MFLKFSQLKRITLIAILLSASEQVIFSQPLSINFDGHAAPEFPGGLTWLNTKNPIKLQSLKGKFVLLDFWTFCCINCMHVIPDLKKLEAKYAEELVVIGVHSAKFQNEKDTDQIREAVLRYGIRHPVVNDADFKIWNKYGAKAWPTFVLINPNGRVLGSLSGEGVYEPMDRTLSLAIPVFEKRGELHRSPLELTLEEAARPETLLSYPGKISADSKSQRLFITDSNHNRILITSSDGKILDVIGEGDEGKQDGAFQSATFNHPQGTFFHQDILYIADTENHLIRVADFKSRTVSTVLGTGMQARQFNIAGKGTEVSISSPWDVLVHEATIYIAMAGSHQIWEADLKTWEAKPFAGSARENIVDDERLKAALAQTSGLTTDGKKIYFADSETSSIRSVDVGADGPVRTLVGKGLFDFGDIDGSCKHAQLQHPLGVAFQKEMIYVADTYNSRIKVIDPQKCSVKTLAGSGSRGLMNGKAMKALFNEPGGLVGLNEKLYVADTNNHVVRVIDPKSGIVSSLELTNIGKLSPPQKSSFKGRPVQLGNIQVEAGKTELEISFKLPEGYKLNQNAPLYLNWYGADPGQIELTNDTTSREVREIKFPVVTGIKTLKQKSLMKIDAVIYYCTNEQSVCLVDRIQASVELVPSVTAPPKAAITIEVRQPGKT